MKKHFSFRNFWFIVITIYLSYINLFVIRTTPELLFPQFILLVLIYKNKEISTFIGTWVPFIGFFLLYEFLRGYADNISPFKKMTLFWIFHVEKSIFPILPNIFLQQSLLDNKTILNISLFFYLTFFYYSFFVGFMLWLRNKKIFSNYSKGFVLLSFMGLLTFFFLPTAPPWYIANIFDINILRPIYEETIVARYSGISLYSYFILGNKVAAFPSLHTAWPAFSSLFLIKNHRNKILYLTLIIPIMIGFSVILTGEHFLLDVIAGWLYAYIAINCCSNITKVFHKYWKKFYKKIF